MHPCPRGIERETIKGQVALPRELLICTRYTLHTAILAHNWQHRAFLLEIKEARKNQTNAVARQARLLERKPFPHPRPWDDSPLLDPERQRRVTSVQQRKDFDACIYSQQVPSIGLVAGRAALMKTCIPKTAHIHESQLTYPPFSKSGLHTRSLHSGGVRRRVGCSSYTYLAASVYGFAILACSHMWGDEYEILVSMFTIWCFGRTCDHRRT